MQARKATVTVPTVPQRKVTRKANPTIEAPSSASRAPEIFVLNQHKALRRARFQGGSRPPNPPARGAVSMIVAGSREPERRSLTAAREMVDDPEGVGCPSGRLLEGNQQCLLLGGAPLPLGAHDYPNTVISRGEETDLLSVASRATPDLGHRSTIRHRASRFCRRCTRGGEVKSARLECRCADVSWECRLCAVHVSALHDPTSPDKRPNRTKDLC